MTQLIGGGGANIAVPFPTVIPAVFCNLPPQSASYTLPHPANDGRSINNTGSTIVIYSTANAALYTITAANINASATLIAGVWLDTVNGVIWALGTNASAGHGYLATINYTSGAVTAIGTGFTGPTNTLPTSTILVQVERATIGTGDLTFWNGTWSFSLSTTTGLVTVAEAQTLLNGIGLAATTENVWYSTLDKTLFVTINTILIGSGVSSPNITSLTIFRNGRKVVSVFDASGVGGMGGSGTGAATIFVFPWKSNQVFLSDYGTSETPIGVAAFNRSSFDGWLQTVATNLGMP